MHFSVILNSLFLEITPSFLQKDVLDSLEFATGSAESYWGSVRAKMGHPEPFPLKYVAIGNEDCYKEFYKGKV
jgi:alpha-L-arabinofuranosidase